jgi:hypothetical protein
MKKLLVVLLILAVAGGLFAQGLTLTGEIKTGVGVYSDFDSEESNFTVGHDDPFERSRWRITGTAGAENYGLKFGLQGYWQADGSDNGGQVTESFDNAYGWFETLDDMLKFRAGRIADKAWSTGGDKGWDYSRGDAFTVEVKPIEGLNVGFALKANDGREGENGARLAEDVGDIGSVFGGTVIGASYNTDLFGVTATVDLDGSADNGGHIARLPARDGDNAERYRNDFASIIFGINLKMVENLTAIIEGNISIDNTKDAENTGTWLTQKFEYKVDPKVTVGLVAYEMFASGDGAEAARAQAFVDARGLVDPEDIADVDGKDYLFAMQFKPYGSYALSDTMTIGAEVFLTMNALDDDFDNQGNKFRDGSAFTVDIKPKFTYKVNTLTMEIFDRINNLGADNEVINNRFGVNFLLTF